MFLSDNLRYLRKKNNYGQEEVAKALGYKSYTTIQKWESGTSEPPVKVLRKIAELYSVSLNDLTDVDLKNQFHLPVVGNIDLTQEKFAVFGKEIDELSQDELEEVVDFIKYIKSKRK